MVPVPVGDQDGGAGRAHARELQAELCGVVTRIDDDGFGRAALRAQDVAILLGGAQHVSVDHEAHQANESKWRFLCTITVVESWRLRDIPTEGGSRSPVVLHTGDEGRAVLIGLESGQELGDHQVKESAFLVVLEGSVRVSAGGEELEAEAGTLVLFDPDERRSVTAAEGARILLLLAPWPGPGHYRAEEMQSSA